MVCACDVSVRHRHSLCFSAAVLILPAALFTLWRGLLFLGCIGCILTCTSLLYHCNHTDTRRTADVQTINFLAVTSLLQIIREVLLHGFSAAVGYSLASAAACISLNFAPVFRQASRPHVLALPGHFVLHATTAALFVSMALAIT